MLGFEQTCVLHCSLTKYINVALGARNVASVILFYSMLIKIVVLSKQFLILLLAYL